MCIGVVRFYCERDPVRVARERHLHFVDVEREETGGLLALEASCALFEVVLLLEIVGRTSGPASVERLLAATDKILIWGYFILNLILVLGYFIWSNE